MAYIRFDESAARAALRDYQTCSNELYGLINQLNSVRRSSGMSTSGLTAIFNTVSRITRQLESDQRGMRRIGTGISDVIDTYNQYEKKVLEKYKGIGQPNSTASGGTADDDIAEFFRNAMALFGTGGYTVGQAESSDINWDDIWKGALIGAAIGSVLLAPAGIWSFIPGAMIGASIAADDSIEKDGSWLDYEKKENGVTAWIGKGSLKKNYDDGSAELDGYLGRFDAEGKTKFNFFGWNDKGGQKDGVWSDKEHLGFVENELSFGVGVSVLSLEGKETSGDDMAGLESKIRADAGYAKAEGKAAFSLNEDGITAVLRGEAMASIVSGEASGTINIGGLKITPKIGGYAGAVGVKGKFGFEDGEFVAEGGAAAGLGYSAGFSIGLNDTGKQKLKEAKDYLSEGYQEFSDGVEVLRREADNYFRDVRKNVEDFGNGISEGWDNFVDFVTGW